MSAKNILGVGTHIKVKDIEASRAFYESLGLEMAFAYGDDNFLQSIPESVPTAPEKYRGITFSMTEHNALEIAEDHIAIEDKSVFGEDMKNSKVSAMLKVNSLVPIIESLGDKLTFPVRKYYWGTIEAAFRDPDGFVIVAIAPFSEEEMSAVKELRNVEIVDPS